MKAQIDVAAVQKLLPAKRRILYFELVGLAAFFCAFLFSTGSLPSIGLFIAGAIGIARGEDERRWSKKLTALMNE
jgi:hypothetical protein